MSPKSSYEILDKHTIVDVLCMKWTSHRISFLGCEIVMKDALSQNKSTIVLHSGNLYRSECDLWIFYILRRCMLPELNVCMSSMTGVLKETTTVCPSRAPEFTPGFYVVGFFCGVRVAHLFSVLCCPIMCLYLLSSVS